MREFLGVIACFGGSVELCVYKVKCTKDFLFFLSRFLVQRMISFPFMGKILNKLLTTEF